MAKATRNYVIGIDYGTDSVRTVIVDAANGREISSAVKAYTRWSKGLYCAPEKNQFRQHPLDYLEGLEKTVKAALKTAPAGAARSVRAISIDTTGSTPVAVDAKGTPLALLKGFENNPNAMFILWKDHTAVQEAEEINRLAKSWGGVDFTRFEGGVYSSEWFWSKILHVLRADQRVAAAAFSWVEHCDWLPAELTGDTNPLALRRSRCAAGHKAMWHAEFNGLPSQDFLTRLDPKLAGLRQHLFSASVTADTPVGTLSPAWAKKLGLSTDVLVGAGAFDAHIGAVGGEISPYHLIKVMGTSTCDMIVAPLGEMQDKLVRGICGQVDGSIVPGLLGLEAGQSAFGDVYAWFRNVLAWPLGLIAKSKNLPISVKKALKAELEERIIPELSAAAERIPVGESGIVALDWLNGRRTPDANQNLKGALAGLTLGSDAPRIFRALVEATAFGSRAIVERFREEGVRIEDVIAVGGVAKKSPFVVQVTADVLNMPIKVARSEQTVALGAAMFAAVVAGLYKDIPSAQKAMGSGFEKTYRPIPKNAQVYDALYRKYLKLGAFIENGLTGMK
jgi:L-ribulokinase